MALVGMPVGSWLISISIECIKGWLVDSKDHQMYIYPRVLMIPSVANCNVDETKKGIDRMEIVFVEIISGLC